MKRLLLVLLTVLTLTACSSANTTVSNPSEVLISSGKETYTKEDHFNDMKIYDYSSIVLSNLVNDIATLEEIDLTEVHSAIDAEIEELKTLYGTSYEAIMSYYGGEEYFKETMISSAISEELSTKYFEANLDTYKESYKPLLGKLIYFENLEDAQATVAAIKEGKTFEMAAAENNYGSEIVEEVFTDKSELSVEVKSFLNTVTEPTVSPVILTSIVTTLSDGTTSTTDRYYVIEVTNTNVDEFETQFIEELVSIVDSTEILNFFFEKYDIEVFDQRTYELLTATYKGIK